MSRSRELFSPEKSPTADPNEQQVEDSGPDQVDARAVHGEFTVEALEGRQGADEQEEEQ